MLSLRSTRVVFGGMGRSVALTRLNTVRHKSKLFAPAPRKQPVKLAPLVAPQIMSLQPISLERAPLECWIDSAPSEGLIAVVVGTICKLFRLKSGWEVPGRDNNWAEMVAFELLVQILISDSYTGAVTVYSDSAIALGVFNGAISKVSAITQCGQRIQPVRSMALPFTITGVKVPGEENVADALSRGKMVVGYSELAGAVSIPEALKAFFEADRVCSTGGL